MMDELKFNEEDLIKTEHSSGANAVNLTINYIRNRTKSLRLSQKEMWREVVTVALGKMDVDNTLLQGLIKYDNEFVANLERFFDYQKKQAVFPADFDSNKAASVIYSIVLTQFMFYLFSPEATLEQLQTIIERQVQFVFEGKDILNRVDF